MGKSAKEIPWLHRYLEGLLSDPKIKAARHQSVPSPFQDPSLPPDGETRDLGEILAAQRRVILLGPSRYGKTTLLLAILHDYASQRAGSEGNASHSTYCDESRIPFYLDLAQLSSGEGLEALASRQCFSLSGCAISPPDIGEALRVNDGLVLIDHLDRLAGRRQLEGMNALREFMVERYPHQKYVIALPEHEYPLLEDWLPSAHLLHLAPFSREGVIGFLHSQYGEVQARRVTRLLGNQRLWELMQDPLALPILVDLLQEVGPGEPRRAVLVKTVVEKVLEGSEQLAPPLASLALALEQEGQEEMELARCQEALPGKEACEELIRRGILRSTPDRRGVTFRHPVVRRFLAAQALAEALGKDVSLSSLLGAYSPAWTEVASLLYGIMSHPRLLIEQLVSPEASFEAVLLAATCVVDNETATNLRQVLQPDFFNPQLHLLLGKAFRHLGRHEEARVELEEALRFKPERADIHYELAQVLGALGKREGALAEYQRASGIAPPSMELAVEMALERAQGQDPGQAAGEINQALQALIEKRAQAYSQLADLYLQQGSVQQALVHARQALQWASSPRCHSQMGRILLRLGELDKAKEHFQKALALDPGLTDARLGLGSILEQEGDLAGALEQYGAALEREPDQPGHYLRVGRAYRLKGQFPLAKVFVGSALDLDPHHAEALAELGALLESQGRYAEAAEQLRRAIDLEPQEAFFHYRLGWLLKLCGRPLQAEAELRETLKLQADNAEFHNQLGVVLADQERHGEALAEYQRAAELEPTNPLYQRNVGVAYAQLGEEEKALAAFQRAIDLCYRGTTTGPQRDSALLTTLIAADAHSERGQILEKRGDQAVALREYQRAVELMPAEPAYRLRQALAYGHFSEPHRMLHILRRMVQMRPEDGLARYHLGEALEAVGRLEEALVEYQQGVQLMPQEGPFRKNLGRVQRSLGDPEASASTLAEACRLLPGDADCLYQLGLSLEKANRLEEAEERYRGAARLDVNREDYWLALGRCCRALGRLADSQTALRRVLFLNPGHSRAYSELAQTCVLQGRLPEALDSLLAALRGDPEVGAYHYQGADIYRQMGRLQEALRLFQRAVELEPHQSAWRRGLGGLLEELGEWENALSEYEKACQWEPDSPQCLFDLARLHHRLGSRKEALAELERAVALDPQGSETRTLLVQMLMEDGSYHQALEHCQTLLGKEPPDPYHLYLASLGLRGLGRMEEAMGFLERATRLQPDNPAWQRELGQVYAAGGRLLEAQQAYSRALQLSSDADLRRELAGLYLRLGWRQEAIKELQMALEGAQDLPDEARARWQIELGDAYQEVGDWEKARAAYDGALGLVENKGEVYERRGALLVRLGRYQEAKSQLDQAFALGYTQPRASHTLSLALLGLGDTDGALRQAIKAAFAEPSNPQFQRHLGSVLRQKGDLSSAMNYLQRALELSPQDPQTLDELGLAYERKGILDKALEYYGEAVRLASEEPLFHLHLGRLLLAQGDTEGAEKQLEKAVEGFPGKSEARFLLGEALERQGRLERAGEQYAAAAQLEPTQGLYHYRLGQVMEALGDGPGAVAALRRAIELDDDNASWHARLAALHDRLREKDLACQEYQRALELAPQDVQVLLGAGAFYVQVAPEKALPLLETAVGLDRSSAEGHHQLGLAHLALGRTKEGLGAIQRAVELAPKEASYQIHLANAYRLMGDFSEASKRLLALSRERPGEPEAYYYLGLSLADQRWHSEAAGQLARAVELAPQEPRYRWALAETCVALDQYDEAVEHLRQAVASPLMDGGGFLRAGKMLEGLGKLEEALAVYQQALEGEQRAELYYQASRILRHLGRHPDALASLQAALALEENNPSWHNELGELQEACGEVEASLSSFRRASALKPQEPVYHRNVGVALEKVHRYEEATVALEEALRLRPDYQDALRHLASATAKLTLERAKKRTAPR